MRYVATLLALFVVATAAAAEEWRSASGAEPDPIVLRPSEPPAETTATLLELKGRSALPAPTTSGPETSGPETTGPKTTGVGANGGGTKPASPRQPTTAAQPSPPAALPLAASAAGTPALGASPAPAPKPVAITAAAADDDDRDDDDGDGGEGGDDDD